ncbi:hypothetical protein [Alteribacillus bidgolensis]|uniref:Uncharacterized protein n=1 Tax=Alteribacillus bidgolensis TaxID=930129 RepID=A0A1G8PZ01_9BACI|nr:hypothetical protein [Alteribacillus bidgolensis]SDI97691.1 hypothetical protein SAMN05216352_1173 [Alteribacillus bidgolensis]
MEAILYHQKIQQTQPKRTFSQWVLKNNKCHKKKTPADTLMGLILNKFGVM